MAVGVELGVGRAVGVAVPVGPVCSAPLAGVGVGEAVGAGVLCPFRRGRES